MGTARTREPARPRIRPWPGPQRHRASRRSGPGAAWPAWPRMPPRAGWRRRPPGRNPIGPGSGAVAPAGAARACTRWMPWSPPAPPWRATAPFWPGLRTRRSMARSRTNADACPAVQCDAVRSGTQGERQRTRTAERARDRARTHARTSTSSLRLGHWPRRSGIRADWPNRIAPVKSRRLRHQLARPTNVSTARAETLGVLPNCNDRYSLREWAPGAHWCAPSQSLGAVRYRSRAKQRDLAYVGSRAAVCQPRHTRAHARTPAMGRYRKMPKSTSTGSPAASAPEAVDVSPATTAVGVATAVAACGRGSTPVATVRRATAWACSWVKS